MARAQAAGVERLALAGDALRLFWDLWRLSARLVNDRRAPALAQTFVVQGVPPCFRMQLQHSHVVFGLCLISAPCDWICEA